VYGAYALAYDGENRLKTASRTVGEPMTYEWEYDGEGRRVLMKTNGLASTLFVYDAAGQLAAEYGGAGDGGTWYLGVDHLGSTRLMVKEGTPTDEVRRYDYLPYGPELLAGGRTPELGYGLPGPRLRFTGKERDYETGLDYFGARYFSGAQGRFTSPDEPFADQYESDPQSWNLYSYGRNNPLRFIDPTGRKCVKTDGGGWADDGTGGGCEAAGVDPSGRIKSQKVEVNDTAPPSPELLALALGMRRAEPVVNAAAVGTAVVMTGGFAGMGYGAVAGGAGLQQLGVAAGPAAYSLLPEIGRKLDYLFGLARGSVHNIQRSTSMLAELRRIGLNDTADARGLVQAHLGRVLNHASNIVSQTGGRTVRESFLMGPTGGVKLETVWEGTKLITMKVLGGGR
jgi:RHS repeat-associated protein